MIWRDQTSTAVFYKFMASLRETIHKDVRKSSATHRFIRTIRDQKKLVRCYTQNIDSIERREGLCANLTRGKGSRMRFTKKALQNPQTGAGSALADALDRGCEVVQLHGDLQTLRCSLCQQCVDWESGIHNRQFLAGRAPHCSSCTATSESRQDRGKRGTKIGTLRPNVVLYGEEHPDADAIGEITTHDLSLSPDLLLVLGTSLHVHGLRTLVREFSKTVHARPGKQGKVIFINNTKPAESVWKDFFDYWVGMDCDRWVKTVKTLRPDIWRMQTQLSPPITKPGKSYKALKEGKENVVPDSEEEDLPSSSSSSPKVVIVTPKKAKRPLTEWSPITGLASKPLRGSKLIPDSDPQSSLPTPPSSGPETFSSSRKRRRFTEDPGKAILETPSKRRRTVQIWED